MSAVQKIKPIPEGMPTLVPYLVINGAADAIATHVRDVAAGEIRAAMDAMSGGR
jgi:hypothetical protein